MKEFDLSTQIDLFANLKQLRFSGQLLLTNTDNIQWTIYLHGGHIFYATGGSHPVRRWYRNLAVLPENAVNLSSKESEVSAIAAAETNRCWQYRQLCYLVQQGKVTREQATRIIWSTLIEIWFDVTQTTQINYELKQISDSAKGIVLLDGSRVVTEVERQRLAWRKAQVANFDPNRAPLIKQREQLEQSISTPVFEMLSQSLDGEKSLRDVAIEMKRNSLTVTCFLLPYIQSGLVELINIPDLPAPVLAESISTQIQQPLIACVDDSPLICNALEKFLAAKGYRFVGVNEPLRAFSVLLALKPDLIFLDLMMPNTNGYEVCEKLRQISHFRHTPIIILTGNNGVFDRVRAKMVGASGFLNKSQVDGEMVIEVLDKHLRHCTLSQLKINEAHPVRTFRNTSLPSAS